MAEPTRKSSPSQGHKRRSQPITHHPLFPAIVALWFAALLGLGSFALRTALIESLVVAARIDNLVPAAAPPLGLTARLLLALLFGAIGGAIGWFLARRIAGVKDAPRRQVFDVADADLASPFRRPEPAAATPLTVDPVAAAPVKILDPSSLFAEPLPATPLPANETPTVAPIEPEAEPLAPSTPTAAQRIASAELAELSHVELVERLAIALQRRQERLEATPAEPAASANPVLHFPDFADRRSARQPLPATESRKAPQETERALRDALAQLQRMSGGA